MEIAKHISTLLQFHECVIVPEFGGFISNYIPAQYDEVNHSLTPPSKTVVFNSKICNNDGLLINHIVENEKIGYEQAQTTVLNFIDDIFQELYKGETIKLNDLGTFNFDKTGAIVFNAYAKFELISSYGLKSFSYPCLDQSSSYSNFRTRPAVRTINGKKDFVKIAASIALLLSLSLFPLNQT